MQSETEKKTLVDDKTEQDGDSFHILEENLWMWNLVVQGILAIFFIVVYIIAYCGLLYDQAPKLANIAASRASLQIPCMST